MKPTLTRRTFLAASVAAIKFPKDVRHRLSVSTYPFREVIVSPRKPTPGKLTLEQFAASIVEKFNVYGIEPWSRHFESIEPDYVAHLAAAFKNAGLRVVNIPCDVDVKLCADQESALATYRKWVDAAVTLGSPSIRVHCPEGKTPDDIACAVDGLKKLAAYGASKNIVINLENDDPSSEDPARIVRVIKAANTRYLRSLPDFCNSMLIQNDQNYNARALASLFPYACNISHVKDLEIDNGKRFEVNVDRIFAIAKKAHYRGFFSMESESDRDPYDSTKDLIAASVRNLEAK